MVFLLLCLLVAQRLVVAGAGDIFAVLAAVLVVVLGVVVAVSVAVVVVMDVHDGCCRWCYFCCCGCSLCSCSWWWRSLS